MEPKTYFDVAGQVVSAHPVDVVKLEMRAHGSMAAGCFWQVHDFAASYAAAVPAEGAVPVKSWPCYAGVLDYKEFKNGELHLEDGLYICTSTTEATKTLGTSNNKFAMLQVELVENDAMAGVTGVSDGGTGVTTLEVLAEPAAGAVSKRLVRVHCVNNEAGIRYLQLFAQDQPPVGTKPLKVWTLAATGDTGDTVDLRFGDGLWVRDNDGSGGTRRGITFMLSTTESTLTEATGDGMNILAEKI